MSSGGYSSSHLSLHVGASFIVRCSTYPDQAPILTIDAGGTCLAITPSGRDADDDAVRFARELAQHAQAFAAEVARLHLANLGDSGAPDDGAPGGAAADTDKTANSTTA